MQPQAPVEEPQTEMQPVKATPPQAEPRARVTLEILRLLPETEQRDRYINTLVEAEMEREAFEMDQRRARVFALSGEFSDIKGETLEQSIAKAMAKIELGRSWGFTPGDAMKNIYFTNGRPNIENALVAAKLMQAGWSWDPEFEYDQVQHKGKPYKRCIGCTLYLKKWDGHEYKPVLTKKGEQASEFFTLAEAEHVKIWDNKVQKLLSEKFNYESWPHEMYYWRSVGRIHKFRAPNVLRGGVIRETALDVIPGDAPPELLPPDLQGNEAPEPLAPEPKRRLRDQFVKAEEPVQMEIEEQPKS